MFTYTHLMLYSTKYPRLLDRYKFICIHHFSILLLIFTISCVYYNLIYYIYVRFYIFAIQACYISFCIISILFIISNYIACCGQFYSFKLCYVAYVDLCKRVMIFWAPMKSHRKSCNYTWIPEQHQWSSTKMKWNKWIFGFLALLYRFDQVIGLKGKHGLIELKFYV